MIESYLQNIIGRCEAMREDCSRLIRDYSSIYYESFRFILTSPDYWFKELSDEGKKLQVKIISSRVRLKEEILWITRNLPKHKSNQIEDQFNWMERYISQNQGTFRKSEEEIVKELNKYFQVIMDTLEEYYKEEDGRIIIVPDTNAFLINYNIEHWNFEEFAKFEIHLAPTILKELDHLKVYAKNQDVQKKSKKIIRKIKEYRRRDKLSEGVTIAGNRIWLRAIALEPDMENTREGLDINNNDDRFLATVMEVTRENLNSSVILVTADINLQNKAEYHGIPFLEVPES